MKYTIQEAQKCKATACTYVGSVSIHLPDNRGRITVITRKGIRHARQIAINALNGDPKAQGLCAHFMPV